MTQCRQYRIITLIHQRNNYRRSNIRRQGLPINLQNTMKLHSKCVAAASPALSPVISVV